MFCVTEIDTVPVNNIEDLITGNKNYEEWKSKNIDKVQVYEWVGYIEYTENFKENRALLRALLEVGAPDGKTVDMKANIAKWTKMYDIQDTHPVIIHHYIGDQTITVRYATHSEYLKQLEQSSITLSKSDFGGKERAQYISPIVEQYSQDTFKMLIEEKDISIRLNKKILDKSILVNDWNLTVDTALKKSYNCIQDFKFKNNEEITPENLNELEKMKILKGVYRDESPIGLGKNLENKNIFYFFKKTKKITQIAKSQCHCIIF